MLESCKRATPQSTPKSYTIRCGIYFISRSPNPRRSGTEENGIANMSFCSVTSTSERFGNCLANFQIHDLLILKKSMESMDLEDDAEASGNCEDTINTPQRMALMAADRSVERGSSGSGSSSSWHSDHPATWVEEKPSKLQTLFQISITALAFLSFGGYLLCLIVQAIKSKGTTYFHPVATATTTSTNGNVKRIKIYRRSRRSINSHIPHVFFADYITYVRALRSRDNTNLVGS